MVIPEGLEPSTSSLEVRCSIQLSYGTAHDLLAGVAYRFQAALWGLGLRSCGFPWKWNPPLTSGL